MLYERKRFITRTTDSPHLRFVNSSISISLSAESFGCFEPPDTASRSEAYSSALRQAYAATGYVAYGFALIVYPSKQ